MDLRGLLCQPLPLVGFWAGGEIGPQAMAEAAPVEATRTGRAALQGFTAVFGIFRAPARTCRGSLLCMLSDEGIPEAVPRRQKHDRYRLGFHGTHAFSWLE